MVTGACYPAAEKGEFFSVANDLYLKLSSENGGANSNDQLE